MKCAIILLALISGVLSQALYSPIEDEAMKEFINGNHAFSAGVYKEIAKYELGNFHVCPISVETVLAMLHEGARGETASQFVSAIHLPSVTQKIQYAFGSFLPSLNKNEEHFKMFSANRLYLGSDYSVKESWKKLAVEIYHSGCDHVDFALNTDAAKTINKWVADNTYNKIHDLVKAENYNENTKMVLVNTLYFSGEWVHKFDYQNTTKQSFYNSQGDSVEVDTMYQLGHFNYYNDLTAKAQFLEIPYKGNNISFVVILPHEGQSMSDLEALTDSLLQTHNFQKQKVAVELPKFKIQSEVKFVPILENIGLKKAFHSGADFTGISENAHDLVISDVIQKTHISLNEAGTEAPVAGGAGPSPTDPVDPIVFKANRPFMYYITYQGIICFIGRVNTLAL